MGLSGRYETRRINFKSVVIYVTEGCASENDDQKQRNDVKIRFSGISLKNYGIRSFVTKIRFVEKIAKFFELGLLTREIFDQTTIFAKKKFLTLMQKKTFCQKLFFCQSLKNFAIFDSTTV